MSGSAAIDAGASDQRRSVVSPDQRKLMTLSLQEVHTSSHIDFGTVHWWGIVEQTQPSPVSSCASCSSKNFASHRPRWQKTVSVHPIYVHATFSKLSLFFFARQVIQAPDLIEGELLKRGEGRL